VKFGPKPKLSPIQIAEARKRINEGETPTSIAAILGVSRQTISRAVL
jgi:DNA invertase Pin-like site-specific DNA recombinase